MAKQKSGLRPGTWTIRDIPRLAPEVARNEVAMGLVLHGDVSGKLPATLPRLWIGCDLRETAHWPKLLDNTEFVDCDLTNADMDGMEALNLAFRGTEQDLQHCRARMDGFSLRDGIVPGLRIYRAVGRKVTLDRTQMDGGQIKQSLLPGLIARGLTGEHVHLCEGTNFSGGNLSDGELPGLCAERSIAKGDIVTLMDRIQTMGGTNERPVSGLFWRVDWGNVSALQAGFQHGHFEGGRVMTMRVDGETGFEHATVDNETTFHEVKIYPERWLGVPITSAVKDPVQRHSNRRVAQPLTSTEHHIIS